MTGLLPALNTRVQESQTVLQQEMCIWLVVVGIGVIRQIQFLFFLAINCKQCI